MADFTEVGVKAVVKNLNGFMGDLGKMDTGVSKLSQIVTGGLSVAFGNVLTGALNLATSAISSAAGAVADFAGESIGLASEFQDKMVVLGLAATDFSDDFGSIKDVALAVGGDIRLAGISASGAAEGMTELFKAGLETEAIFGDLNAFMNEGAELGGALKASIDLAAASELELADAANLSAVVLSTFGDAEASAADQAEFVNFALNNMVKAADASVADVSDLAAALTNVGPTAASAGMDLDEVNTALAILSTRGIVGAEAGTALKSAIANMRRPTAAVQDELSKWGISLFDTEGNMYDMVEIIGQFQLALGDATEEQKAQAIQTIAGTYGMNAMNALLSEGVEGWADMQEAMENATGVEEQAAAKTKTFTGMQEALEGTIETLKIQIGDALLPVLGDLLTWFTGLVDRVAPKVVTGVQFIGEAFQKWVGVLLGAVAEGTVFNQFMQNIAAWFKEFLPIAIEVAKTYFNDVFLPALLNLWAFINTTLIPVFQVIWSWLSQLLPVAVGILTSYWEEVLLPTILKLWELWNTTILPALSELWKWLQEVIPVAIETLASFWTETLLPVLATVYAWISENLLPIFAQIVAWLITNIPTAIETVSTFWTETLKPALDTIWEAFRDNIIPILEDVWTWLEENLPGAIETLKTFWEETLLPAITKIWEFIQDDLIPIWADLYVWLFETIPVAIESLKTLWEETLLPAIKAIWTFIDENLIPVWELLEEVIKLGVEVAFLALANVWEETLKPALNSLWEFFKEDILPILEKVKNFIVDNLEPAFVNFKKNAIDKWVTSFNSLKDTLTFLKDKLVAARDKLIELGPALPDWADPGSPPPLYYALQDINRALDEMNTKQLPRMQMELSDIAPLGASFAAPLQAMSGPQMAAQSVMQTTVNINQNNNINGGIGQNAFEQTTLNAVNRALATGTG